MLTQLHGNNDAFVEEHTMKLVIRKRRRLWACCSGVLDSFDVTGFGDGVDLLLPFWCSDGFWVIGLIPWVQAFWELERL
jgi:hypothetical protein